MLSIFDLLQRFSRKICVSTGVGDHFGRPPDAELLFYLLKMFMRMYDQICILMRIWENAIEHSEKLRFPKT